jgi:hypothetical protein
LLTRTKSHRTGLLALKPIRFGTFRLFERCTASHQRDSVTQATSLLKIECGCGLHHPCL